MTNDPDSPEPQNPTRQPPMDADLYFELILPVEPDGGLDLADLTLDELLDQARAYNDEIKRKESASREGGGNPCPKC